MPCRRVTFVWIIKGHFSVKQWWEWLCFRWEITMENWTYGWFSMNNYMDLFFFFVCVVVFLFVCFLKIEIISLLSYCNWACLIFKKYIRGLYFFGWLFLSHFKLQVSVSLSLSSAPSLVVQPRIVSYQFKMNQSLSEKRLESCMYLFTDVMTHAGALLASAYNKKCIFKVCNISD